MYFQDYKSVLDNTEPHLLLDVRPLVEVDICHLPFSVSILSVIEAQPSVSPVILWRHMFIFHAASHFFVVVPDIVTRHSPLKFRGEEE